MTTPVVVDGFLAHYGKKGMKWGVRKDSGGSSKSASTKSKERSSDDVIFNDLRHRASTKGVQALSNDEIRVLTTRAEALQRYSKAFPAPKSRKQKVAEFIVKDVLVNTGKSLVKETVSGQVRSAISKKGG